MRSVVGSEELAAVARVIEDGYLGMGSEVQKFEQELTEYIGGNREVVCLSTCTAALHLALQCCDIGPGDEVLAPSFTFVATFQAISASGATAVSCEADPLTGFIDVGDAERRITPRTKAIMPVHLFGRPAPIAELRLLGLPLLEDAAQAFGSPGIATSVAATFSFFPTKNLFALGDGGLVAVNDAGLDDRIRMLRFHGSRAKKDFELIGYNSRLDALQAACLRVFLRHLDTWTEQRRDAAARYAELGLAELVELPRDEPGHVYHMYCVRSPERDRLSAALTEARIGHAVYYLPPLHLQPALRYLGYSAGDLPETEKAARENLCLPLWAGIEQGQQAEVVATLRRAARLVEA
jgi:dTDP-4-amino-4,6-dideoxygalactose transaminase